MDFALETERANQDLEIQRKAIGISDGKLTKIQRRKDGIHFLCHEVRYVERKQQKTQIQLQIEKLLIQIKNFKKTDKDIIDIYHWKELLQGNIVEEVYKLIRENDQIPSETHFFSRNESQKLNYTKSMPTLSDFSLENNKKLIYDLQTTEE